MSKSKNPTKREVIAALTKVIAALTKDVSDLRTRITKLEGQRDQLLAIEQRVLALEYPTPRAAEPNGSAAWSADRPQPASVAG
jgi:hypothetical protein